MCSASPSKNSFVHCTSGQPEPCSVGTGMHVNLSLASTADGAAISARASARATRDVIVGGEQCPPAPDRRAF